MAMKQDAVGSMEMCLNGFRKALELLGCKLVALTGLVLMERQ